MKKMVILMYITLLLQANFVFAETLKGRENAAIEVAPSVDRIYNGPEFKKGSLKKLELPDGFYSAYYRILIGAQEVEQFIIIELIGLHGEAKPEKLFSNYLPINKILIGYLKEELAFKKWLNEKAFVININGDKVIDILKPGYYSVRK